jgi:hypothetical protein
MPYMIKVTDDIGLAENFWALPSELRADFNDVEPTLDHAIKAERFYQRMLGLHTKREQV